MNEIIYYDFDQINRVSFYLNGFFSNQTKYNYKFSIKREDPCITMLNSVVGEWKKFLFGLGLFEFKSRNNNFFFCIDRSDHSSNYMNEGYLIPILEIVKYYFKANYDPTAIDNDPAINKFKDKIIPIGPSFPIHIENMIKFMPGIFPIDKNRWSLNIFKERFDLMFRYPKLSYLKRLRKIEPKLNLFFVLPYYSNQKILNEYRFEVFKAVKDRVKTNTIIGFGSHTKLTGKYEQFKLPRYEMRDYYRHLAGSKIAIYVRGPHNGISSKLGQLLALGKPIIGQTIHNNKEMFYQNQFFNEQFAYDEPEEIAKQVYDLLQHPEKAASFAEANANTFDTRFSPEITVSHILENLFN